MAGKYNHLKGKIPESQPTARSAALVETLKKIEDMTVDELTASYNDILGRAEEVAQEAAVLKLQLDAREILIRKRIDAQGADGIRINGFTWSETFTPYPVCEDPAKIVKWFADNDPGQLELTKTELANRLKAKVKEEAVAGELQIVNVPDPQDPNETITEVRSSVPGVKVFLKGDISRVKSTKKE